MLSGRVRTPLGLPTFLRYATTAQVSSQATETSSPRNKGKGKEGSLVNDFTHEELVLASNFIRARATDVRMKEEEDAARRSRQHAARQTEQRRLRRSHWRTIQATKFGQQQRSFSRSVVDRRQRITLHETNQPYESPLTNLRSQPRRQSKSTAELSPGGSSPNREWEALSERASQDVLSEKSTMTDGVLRPGLLVEARRMGQMQIGVILCQILSGGRIRYLLLPPNGEVQPISEDDVQFIFPSILSFSEEVARQALGLPAQKDPSGRANRPILIIPEAEFSLNSPAVQIRRAMANRIRQLEMDIEKRMRLLSQKPDFQAQSIWQHFNKTTEDDSAWILVTAYQAAAFAVGNSKKPTEGISWLDHFAVFKTMMSTPQLFQAATVNMRKHPKFSLRPRRHSDQLNKVTRWIREHQAVGLSQNIGLETLKPGKGFEVEEFIQYSKRVINARCQRLVERRKEEGTDMPDAKEENLKGIPTFTASSQIIRDVLIRRMLELRTTQVSPYPVLAAYILKALGIYKEQSLDEGMLYRFLTEAGFVQEWDALHELRVSDAEEKQASPVMFRGTTTSMDLDVADAHEAVRHDFADLPVYVIDDPSAQELDDGISIEPKAKDGSQWLHVHVADPTRWMSPTHPLALAAASRGQTLYLPSTTRLLLPTDVVYTKMSLGAQLRSAGESGQPVLTFSARVKEDGSLQDYRIQAGSINRVNITTYSAVNSVLCEPPASTQVVSLKKGLLSQENVARQSAPLDEASRSDIQRLHSLALQVRRQRMGSSGLDVYLPASTVKMVDPPSSCASSGERQWTGTPDLHMQLVSQSEVSYPAQMLVQEFMLLAGRVSGMFCAERGIPAPFRGAAQPFIPSSSLAVGQTSDGVLATILGERNSLTFASDPFKVLPLGIAFAGSPPSIKPVDHWLLGISAKDGGYMRGTSPLRRYGDMLCHWQIKAALLPGATIKTLPFSVEDMTAQILATDEKDRRIRNISKAANTYWITVFLGRIRASGGQLTDAIRLDNLEARVLGGGEFSLAKRGRIVQVFLPELGITASLPLISAGDDVLPGRMLRVKVLNANLWPAPGLDVELGMMSCTTTIDLYFDPVPDAPTVHDMAADMNMSGNAPLRVALSFTYGSAGPAVETTALHLSCLRDGSGNSESFIQASSPVNLNSQGQPSIPLVIAEGLEDGSLLLYHIAKASGDADESLDSDSTPQTGIALTAIRSPTMGTPRGALSPALSRTSSSSNLHLPTYAEPSSKGATRSHSYGLLPKPSDRRLRAPSAASSTSLASSRIDLTEGLGTYGTSGGQPRIASGITLASVNAELSASSTAEEDELKAHLRQQVREPGMDTSAFTLLAGLGRRGIEDDREKPAQQEVKPLPSTKRSRAAAIAERPVRAPRKFSMDLKRGDSIYAGTEDSLKDDKRMETLLETTPSHSRHDHTQCPVDEELLQRNGQIDTPTARIILPRARDNSVIQICDLPGRAQIAILGKRGACTVVDLYTSAVISSISLESSRRSAKKTSLLPPIDWRSLEVFVHDERCFLLATGVLPNEVAPAWSEPTTTVSILEFSQTADITCRGIFALAGLGPTTITALEGRPSIVHITPESIRRYPILFGSSPEGLAGKFKASQPHFRIPGIFQASASLPNTTVPSRAPSRAASLKDGKSGHADLDLPSDGTTGLAKLLRKRIRGINGEEAARQSSHLEVSIDGPQVLSSVGANLRGFTLYGNRGMGWNDQDCQILTIEMSSARLQEVIPFAEESMTALKLTRDPQMCYTAGNGRAFSEAPSSASGLSVSQLPGELRLHSVEDGVCCVRRRMINRVDTNLHLSVDSPSGSATVPDANGVVRNVPCVELLTNGEAENSILREFPLRCMLRTMSRIIVGLEDGAIAVYNKSLILQDRLALFNTPVDRLFVIPEIGDVALKGTILAIDEDGTVGLIDIVRAGVIFVIPAGRHYLSCVFMDRTQILLAYANGKARVWDLETLEFRRSTGFDSAQEMLAEGEWTEITRPAEAEADADSQRPVWQGYPLTGATLELDITALEDSSASDTTSCLKFDLGARKSILANLFPFGADHEADQTALHGLGLNRPTTPAVLGSLGPFGAVSFDISNAQNAWKISSAHTALRQLVLIVFLRPMLDMPELEHAAATLIAFLATLLPDSIGDGYKDSDLRLFVPYSQHQCASVAHAARLLFEARVGRLEEAEVDQLTDTHGLLLPSHVPPSARGTSQTVFALTLLAGIALYKYSLFSPGMLKDISQSILVLITAQDEDQQSVAIDLTQKGFDIWQNYVDPMELLRSLFGIATSRKGAAREAAHARVAVLQLASSHTPLFMSTLSADIVDAETIAERAAVMKLCVHVARKKPIVLFHNLGRLVEAVVHSLDPTRTTMRESIQQTATVILNELVSIFPIIDFCQSTQRLAVGTPEGAVIMYDLKTATRLYVLDTKSDKVAGIAFSPDGRRLVTASLKSRKLTVWKVGSSFSSLFTVGGPPRQGSGPGQPFKIIDFAIGEESQVDSATGLPALAITWPGARSACLTIGQTKLTFAT